MSPITFADLAPSRPPCSVAEHEAAETLRSEFARSGLDPHVQIVRAATSPTWAPLLRSLLRVWAGALLAAGWPLFALALGSMALASFLRPVTTLLRTLPFVGGMSQNVVAVVRGSNGHQHRPLIVSAHLDTHPSGGAPLRRPHIVASATVAVLVCLSSTGSTPAGNVLSWRLAGLTAVIEGLLTLVWIARREFTTIHHQPDDNTSGIMTLRRVAHLLSQDQPRRDVWIAATGAGMVGGQGIRTLLRSSPPLRRARLVEIDALGAGEVIACPYSARFLQMGTPGKLVAAVRQAARSSGDTIDVRRVRRPHSDARAALASRVGAITLTGGIPHPADVGQPDMGNAMRAALLIDQLAHESDPLPERSGATQGPPPTP